MPIAAPSGVARRRPVSQDAAHGDVRVGGAGLLGFDRRDVLHIPPGDAAQVLHRAVHELAELDRASRAACTKS